jgi:hypothetical protein
MTSSWHKANRPLRHDEVRILIFDDPGKNQLLHRVYNTDFGVSFPTKLLLFNGRIKMAISRSKIRMNFVL